MNAYLSFLREVFRLACGCLPSWGDDAAGVPEESHSLKPSAGLDQMANCGFNGAISSYNGTGVTEQLMNMIALETEIKDLLSMPSVFAAKMVKEQLQAVINAPLLTFLDSESEKVRAAQESCTKAQSRAQELSGQVDEHQSTIEQRLEQSQASQAGLQERVRELEKGLAEANLKIDEAVAQTVSTRKNHLKMLDSAAAEMQQVGPSFDLRTMRFFTPYFKWLEDGKPMEEEREAGGNNDIVDKTDEVQEKETINKSSGENEGKCGSTGGGKDGMKLSFSVALSKEEIEEDIFTLTGSKPARWPNKRTQDVQKLVDCVLPGMWLTGITAGSY